MLSSLALTLFLTAPVDVVVYELSVDGFDERQRELLELGIVSEINKRRGLRAMGIAEARNRSGLQEDRGCEPRDCLAQLVDSIGSEQVLTGRITRLGETTAIALRVVDLREQAVIASSTRQLAMSHGDGILAAAGPMVGELFADHPVRTGEQVGVDRALQERWEPAPLGPTAFYTGLAISAAAAVTGTVFGVAAIQRRNEFESLLNRGTQENPVDGAQLTQTEEAFVDARNRANLFFAVSAVAALTTTTLFFFTDFGEDPILTLSPTPEGVAMGASLRF